MASAIPRPLIVSAPADRAAATTSWPSTCKREASLRPIRPVPPKIAIFIMLRSVLELLEVQPSWATAMRQDRDRPYVLDYPLSRSEEHTSELQSLMRISYAVFCLKKKKKNIYSRNLSINIKTTTQH